MFVDVGVGLWKYYNGVLFESIFFIYKFKIVYVVRIMNDKWIIMIKKIMII